MFPPTKGKGALPYTMTGDRPYQAVGDWFCSRASLLQCFLYTCLFETFIPDWVQWSFYNFLCQFGGKLCIWCYFVLPSFLLPSHLQSNKQADAIPGWLLLCSCKNMFITCWLIFLWLFKDLLLIKVDRCLSLGSRLLFCSVCLLDMKMYKISLETQPGGTARRLAV